MPASFSRARPVSSFRARLRYIKNRRQARGETISVALASKTGSKSIPPLIVLLLARSLQCKQMLEPLTESSGLLSGWP